MNAHGAINDEYFTNFQGHEGTPMTEQAFTSYMILCNRTYQNGRLAQLVVCLTTTIQVIVDYQEVAGSSPVLVKIFWSQKDNYFAVVSRPGSCHLHLWESV